MALSPLELGAICYCSTTQPTLTKAGHQWISPTSNFTDMGTRERRRDCLRLSSRTPAPKPSPGHQPTYCADGVWRNNCPGSLERPQVPRRGTGKELVLVMGKNEGWGVCAAVLGLGNREPKMSQASTAIPSEFPEFKASLLCFQDMKLVRHLAQIPLGKSSWLLNGFKGLWNRPLVSRGGFPQSDPLSWLGLYLLPQNNY